LEFEVRCFCNRENFIYIFNLQFGQIRVIEINGKNYFVGSDVAKALGYQRPNDAITQHCRYTAKHRISDNQGVPHDYLIIPDYFVSKMYVEH
jgi:prophage antirepressor-like protein